MTLHDVLVDFERQAVDADRLHSSAPVATVLRSVIDDLKPFTNGAGDPAPEKPRTQLISVQEAAAQIGVPPRWIYEREGKYDWILRLGPRTIRCSVPKLERWLAHRRTTSL